MSDSPYVLTMCDDAGPDRAVYSVATPRGERFDTVDIHRVAPPAETQWLWPERIPLGVVTVVEGPPGSGKSRVACDVAARAAAGRPWPDGTANRLPGADVLVISRQDEAHRITALVQQGEGEKRSVFQFEGFDTRIPATDQFARRPVNLPFDLEALEYHLECNPAIGVVIIDPLTEFCRTPRLMAETLHRLNDLAERGRLAIIVTVAADCRTDAQGRLRESSRSPTATARCVWSIVRDPDDARRRLLVARRTNFCAEPDGLAFCLDGNGVAWDKESAVSALDPLGALGAVDRCLHELLANGAEAASTVVRLGAEQGFSAKQLRSAAKRLRVFHRRMGYSNGGHWEWSLPDCRLADTAEGHEQPTTSTRPERISASDAPVPVNASDEPPVADSSPPLACEPPGMKAAEMPIIEPMTAPSPPSSTSPIAGAVSSATQRTDGVDGALHVAAHSTVPPKQAIPEHFSRRRGRGKYRKRHRDRAAITGITAGGPAESGSVVPACNR